MDRLADRQAKAAGRSELAHDGSIGEVTLSEDRFLGDVLRVLQPRRGYRAGLDAVLLAATVEAPGVRGAPGARELTVLDVGAGVGVVGLCIAARLKTASVTMLEQHPGLIEVAEANITRNGLGDRVDVLQGDVFAPASQCALPGESFDHVVSNPPYYDAAAMRPSADQLKATSHAMAGGGLDDWLRFIARMTRPGGTATLIHRAENLDELLAAMARRFGGLLIQPLHPRRGEAAHRVIVRGTKGSRRPLQLLAGQDLHGRGSAFLPQIDRVLRRAAGFALGAGADGHDTSA